mmetsp:Transcript_17131/g.45050  ORF Transcript_17131/g.45050 Transcript_17131/m.45050 type:complete len:271 (-) Transcript_17131:785-1597(-)
MSTARPAPRTRRSSSFKKAGDTSLQSLTRTTGNPAYSSAMAGDASQSTNGIAPADSASHSRWHARPMPCGDTAKSLSIKYEAKASSGVVWSGRLDVPGGPRCEHFPNPFLRKASTTAYLLIRPYTEPTQPSRAYLNDRPSADNIFDWSSNSFLRGSSSVLKELWGLGAPGASDCDGTGCELRQQHANRFVRFRASRPFNREDHLPRCWTPSGTALSLGCAPSKWSLGFVANHAATPGASNKLRSSTKPRWRLFVTSALGKSQSVDVTNVN